MKMKKMDREEALPWRPIVSANAGGFEFGISIRRNVDGCLYRLLMLLNESSLVLKNGSDTKRILLLLEPQ